MWAVPVFWVDELAILLARGDRIGAGRKDGTSMNGSDLMALLNKASGNMNLKKGGGAGNDNCSDYFWAVGQGLPAHWKKQIGKEWNGEAKDIVRNVADKKNKHWMKVSELRAQILANAGAIVVGLQPHAGNGHIALVAPVLAA